MGATATYGGLVQSVGVPGPLESNESGGQVASIAFTTEGLPPSQQFDAYKQYCSPVIDISPVERSDSGFAARCEMWALGPFAVRRIRTPAGHFARHAVQIRRDGLDHWVFNLVRCGQQEARTLSGVLRTGAGALSVFSLAGAYEARRTDVDWVGLFVPRGAFPTVDRILNHNEHLALDGPLGRLFAAYLTSLADVLPSMSQRDLPPAIQATQVILSEFVTSSADVLSSNDSCFDTLRLRSVRDYIDRNLGSWNLHTGRICKEAGVSRSNLYRMFQPYGGVVRYVQRERLRGAHELLADPTCTRAINAIANDYCFSDTSTFSRAFRQEFGYPPTDLRKHVESGGAAPHNGPRPSWPNAAMGGWEVLYQGP